MSQPMVCGAVQPHPHVVFCINSFGGYGALAEGFRLHNATVTGRMATRMNFTVFITGDVRRTLLLHRWVE